MKIMNSNEFEVPFDKNNNMLPKDDENCKFLVDNTLIIDTLVVEGYKIYEDLFYFVLKSKTKRVRYLMHLKEFNKMIKSKIIKFGVVSGKFNFCKDDKNRYSLTLAEQENLMLVIIDDGPPVYFDIPEFPIASYEG